MFINASAFKKLIKESWSKEGLTMGATEDEIFLAGGSWVIRTFKSEMTNKIKAAIVELTGELPAAGEVFTCYKKEATQYEVAENEYWNICERFKDAKIPLQITKVKYQGVKELRVLQEKESLESILINEKFMNLIDLSAREEMEDIPVGPVTTGTKSGLVYWKNSIMAIAVARIFVNEETDHEMSAFMGQMERGLLPFIQ